QGWGAAAAFVPPFPATQTLCGEPQAVGQRGPTLSRLSPMLRKERSVVASHRHVARQTEQQRGRYRAASAPQMPLNGSSYSVRAARVVPIVALDARSDGRCVNPIRTRLFGLRVRSSSCCHLRSKARSCSREYCKGVGTSNSPWSQDET